jgi:hypothetical protein
MSFPIIVVIILCAFIVLIVLELDRIERGTNRHRCQDSWEKGKSGEYLVYKVLQNYEKDGAKFLFNCYLPKNNNNDTTEIDVIMIHNSGIYVFESKNYSGWIFGSEHQQKWTQTLPGRTVRKISL